MLSKFVLWLVTKSRRFEYEVVFFTVVAVLIMGMHIGKTIKINTDIDQLMAADLEWRIQERKIAEAFPHKNDRLVIVVDGTTPDTAEDAATLISAKLSERQDLFKSVQRPEAIPFFQQNGFLFLSEEELSGVLDMLIKSQPMLGSLAKDPSLRGLFSTIDLALQGIEYGQTSYEQIEPSLSIIAQTIETTLQNDNRRLPWQSMMSDHPPTLRETRKFILVQPVLDFGDLAPGTKASHFIRDLAKTYKLTPDRGITVRLTGSVALNDEEFSSVAEGAEVATGVSLAVVILLLVLALRSWRLIVPILITLIVGLMATTSFALLTIGSLNLISVAFAVMFVGIAVDFGIQFGVRLRDEHHREPDLEKATIAASKQIAMPFSFAAGASALGFLAFIPTSYRGVSELGFIAGAGMLIAFFLNLSVLPALLKLFKPRAEPEAIGYTWAAPIDAFLAKNGKKLRAAVIVIGLAALAISTQTRFDFDPLNLKNPKAESVATMFDIMKDPEATPYTIEILAPTIDRAKELARQIEALAEVDHVETLASFVPENQKEKLALIEEASFVLGPTLNPTTITVPPTDEETLDMLGTMAAKLKTLGEEKKAAQQLASALEDVVALKRLSVLDHLHYTLVEGLQDHLKRLRTLLAVKEVSLETLTDDLRVDWITKDGRALIKVFAKGDARNPDVLAKFTDAVRTIAPEASGPAISIQESGKTVSRAFAQAGAFALVVLALLGFAVLRRWADVIRLILPLMLAGILTLATMVLIGLPLNFANVIALPLLLSLGVTYAIYFISYWKNGQKDPLQSSMARAVLFSAATTLVAFGSLSLSSHTGTRGMGELLTMALIYSLISTFLVLPLWLEGIFSTKASCTGTADHGANPQKKG